VSGDIKSIEPVRLAGAPKRKLELTEKSPRFGIDRF